MKRKTFFKNIISIFICSLLFVAVCLPMFGCVPESVDGVKTLTKIEVNKEPSRTEYYVGETFDKSGMRIVAFYSDKTAEVVTKWTYEPTTALTVENDAVTITYVEEGVTKTCTQAIDVIPEPALPVGIKITAPPSKTEYIEGEKFDASGMAVSILLSDGNVSNDVTSDITYEPFNALTKDDEEITVSYKYGDEIFTAKQPITVREGVATVTFGGGTYQKAHDIVLGEHESLYELSEGFVLGKWDFNGTYKDSPFIRAQSMNENQFIIFTIDFSGVEDKSQIGFSANMNKSRPNPLVQISTDKVNWDDIGYQQGIVGIYNSDYAEMITSLRGRAVADSNLYRMYWSLADYAEDLETDGHIYVKFGFSEEYENSISGPAVGSDVIDGIAYYEKLIFNTEPEHVKYTLTLGEGVSFADGEKTALLRPGKAMPPVTFENAEVELEGVTWTGSNGKVWAPGTFKMPSEDVTVEYSYSNDKYKLTLGEGMTFKDGSKEAVLRTDERLPDITFENSEIDSKNVYWLGSNGTVWTPGTFKMPAENLTLDFAAVVNPFIGQNGYGSSVATQEGQYLIGDGKYSFQPNDVVIPNDGRGELIATTDGNMAQLYNLPQMVDGYKFRLQTTPKRASNTEYTYNIDYTFYNMGNQEITITVYQVNSGENITGCETGTVTIAAGESATVNLTNVGFAGANNFLTYFLFNGVTADTYPVAIHTYMTPVAVVA